RRFAFDHSVVTSPRCVRASAPATISQNSRVCPYVYRRSTGTSTCMPSALLVFGNETSPSASRACLTRSATCTTSPKPTSGEGPRLQMRHEHLCDPAVVVDQVALGDPLVRPEDLVEIGELDLSLLCLARPLASHVLRRLVDAQPLKGRRTQVAVMRPLGKLD